MFVILTYARFATISLANPDRKKAAIEFTKRPGRVISDQRVNIQNAKGKAKTYQVKLVLLAIEKLEVNHGTKK